RRGTLAHRDWPLVPHVFGLATERPTALAWHRAAGRMGAIVRRHVFQLLRDEGPHSPRGPRVVSLERASPRAPDRVASHERPRSRKLVLSRSAHGAGRPAVRHGAVPDNPRGLLPTPAALWADGGRFIALMRSSLAAQADQAGGGQINFRHFP